MGYNLYITRAESHRDTDKVPIGKDEWDSVVATDRDLEVSTTDFYDRKVGSGVERIHPALWSGHPTEVVAFWFHDGAACLKNPDIPTIRKMVELARRLNAKVLGEEDEEYGPDGEPLPRR